MALGDTVSQAIDISFHAITDPLLIQRYVNDMVRANVMPQVDGISGWIFDVKENESLNFESDITDHVMENNITLNEHIVRKPIEVTLSGVVGELVYHKPLSSAVTGILTALAGSLSSISSYLGNYNAQTYSEMQGILALAVNATDFIEQGVFKALDMVRTFDSSKGYFTTLQEKAYTNLHALWQTNQLLTVLTPWHYYQNMVIKSVKFSQDKESNDYTNIEVTLKQMRFTDLFFVDVDAQLLDSYKKQIEPTQVTGQGGVENVDDRDASYLYSGGNNLLPKLLGVK